jgi:hypothetical protein
MTAAIAAAKTIAAMATAATAAATTTTTSPHVLLLVKNFEGFTLQLADSLMYMQARVRSLRQNFAVVV